MTEVNNTMANNDLISQFSQEKTCIYKNERYSVRDNGAVFRHKPETMAKRRPLDETWTFGKKNLNNGYMMHGGHRVHIIVATAYHGAHDSSKFVVDHKDTNRCNNRPENLRWFTRLENALNNPVTRKRIEYVCGGDINRFLEDPKCLRDITGNYQDVMWMRTVTAEEAKNAYARVMSWASKPATLMANEQHSKMGDWMYSPISKNVGSEEPSGFYLYNKKTPTEEVVPLYYSQTPTAKQRYWRTKTDFPFCPLSPQEKTLECYASRIKIGEVVSNNIYAKHFVDEFGIHDNKLYIRSHDEDRDAVKPYSLITVTLEDGFFIHEGRTFFQEDGARKAFTLSMGNEWIGGDVFDDFC